MTSYEDLFRTAIGIIVVALFRVLLILLVLAAIALPVVAVVAIWTHGRRRWRARREGLVEGVAWRTDLAYAPGHTWVRRRGGRMVVGIDDLARRLVMPVRAVSLPPIGATLHAGDVGAEIQAGGKAAPIVSPVDGTVTAVNDEVRRDPSLVERDPYGRGWLYRVAPANRVRPRLRRDQAAEAWLGDESRGLARFLEHELGTAAADGGHLATSVPQSVDEEQWRRITRAFLRAA